MPPTYQEPHWTNFCAIPPEPQVAVGHAPSAWAERFGLTGIPDQHHLPAERLTRETLAAICADPIRDPLFAYVCVMAWGVQGSGPAGRAAVDAAWAHRARLTEKLRALREGNLTRTKAYDFFRDTDAIPGLGPSYFTKLLYFSIPAGIATSWITGRGNR